jgi:ABC-2 type transport system permease protein
LTQPQADRLAAFVKSGKPALILLDPLPAFNINLSPQPGPDATAQPADLRGLLSSLSVDWQPKEIVWDTYNPHPQLRNIPPEVVFVGKGSQAAMPFQVKEDMTSGLQEVVLLYPGGLKAKNDSKTAFVPLLTTGKSSGTLQWDQLVQRTIFGTALAQGLPHEPSGVSHVLAARVTRKSANDSVNAVVVADVDLIGEQFFDLRRRGVETLNFDNVTFILNAVDELAGDRSFIALRKRRPKHRTLEAVEARTRTYEEKQSEETRQAQANAERQLQQAQARLDAAVRQLRQRPDLDEQARQIAISNLEAAENRRLQVARANIEDERQRQIEAARANMESAIRGIESTIKLLAVTLPPIPAFLLFIIVSLNKIRRERTGIAPERLIVRRAT